MNYFLKVKPSKKATQEELDTLAREISSKRGRPLIPDELTALETNVNNQPERLGTLDQLELLVLHYSPKMKELKSQLDFFALIQKFKAFDFSKYNYFAFEVAEYDLLKKLLTHDNYAHKVNGVEVVLQDAMPLLHAVFNMPNTQPSDYAVESETEESK